MRFNLILFVALFFLFCNKKIEATERYLEHGVLLPEMFGAKADGTHDDTQAIQAAIDSLASMGGGTVRLGSGIYLVTSIALGPKVSLLGNGNSATIIKQMKGSKKDCLIVRDVSAALKIADLMVLGNDENSGIIIEQSIGLGENHHYLYSNTAKWDRAQGYKWLLINNVCVYHFGVGLDIRRWGFDINICNSTFSFNGKGVFMGCNDSTLYNCYVTNNSLGGLIIDGYNNKVSNVKSIFNCIEGTENDGAIVVYGSRCQIVNCETQDNYGKGFVVDGQYNIVSNCISNTDGYGKEDMRYDPAIKACGFMINGRYNSFSNCVVSNYNEHYGAVYHSPVIVNDSVSYDYPDIYDNIRVLIEKDRLLFQEPFSNVQTLCSKNRIWKKNIESVEGHCYFANTGNNNVLKNIDCHLGGLQLLIDFRSNGNDGSLVNIDGDKSLNLTIEGKSLFLYWNGEKEAELVLDDDAVLNAADLRLVVAFSQFQEKRYVSMLMFEKTANRGWIKKEIIQETDLSSTCMQKAAIKIGNTNVLVKRLAISHTPMPESVFLPSSNTNRIYDSAFVYVDADSCM